ncbi:hypothetical protein Tco_0497997, partial [Tanacetum coccineum]
MCAITLSKTVGVLKVGTEHNVANALSKVIPGHKLQHCFGVSEF